MRKCSLFTIFLALALALAAHALGIEEGDYQGVFDPSNIQVVVEFDRGFAPPGLMVAGLDCDGHFQIAGAYADTTTIRTTIPPDSALMYINELLAIDFFGQPAEFRAQSGGTRPTEDGKLSLVRKTTIDAGGSKITLHLGPDAHSVTLRFLAPGAPEALKTWDQRFRNLINEQAGWRLF